MKQRKQVKHNPMARELAKPIWRKRIVPSGKTYARKDRRNDRLRDG
jgi:hypothetical protein